MAIPPTCGSFFERYSAISLAGVIGYPAKNRHPVASAASAHASLPCQKYVFASGNFFNEVLLYSLGLTEKLGDLT
jgi:hypothetical protein